MAYVKCTRYVVFLARDMHKLITLRVILLKRMKGGEEVYSLRRYYGKTLFFGVFFCVVLFLFVFVFVFGLFLFVWFAFFCFCFVVFCFCFRCCFLVLCVFCLFCLFFVSFGFIFFWCLFF